MIKATVIENKAG